MSSSKQKNSNLKFNISSKKYRNQIYWSNKVNNMQQGWSNQFLLFMNKKKKLREKMMKKYLGKS